MIRSVCIPLLCTHPSISFPYRLGVASSSDDDEGPWRTFERHVRRAQDWEADPQALAGVDADALASLDPRLRIGRLTPLSRREGLAFDLESSADRGLFTVVALRTRPENSFANEFVEYLCARDSELRKR